MLDVDITIKQTIFMPQLTTSDVGLGEGRLWWRLVDMWSRAFLVLGESLV